MATSIALQRSPEPGRILCTLHGVFFVMRNGQERVRCLVGFDALEHLGAAGEPLEAFHELRDIIEATASRKYDPGVGDPVVVTIADLAARKGNGSP